MDTAAVLFKLRGTIWANSVKIAQNGFREEDI